MNQQQQKTYSVNKDGPLFKLRGHKLQFPTAIIFFPGRSHLDVMKLFHDEHITHPIMNFPLLVYVSIMLKMFFFCFTTLKCCIYPANKC